jgi:hypothetical protein
LTSSSGETCYSFARRAGFSPDEIEGLLDSASLSEEDYLSDEISDNESVEEHTQKSDPAPERIVEAAPVLEKPIVNNSNPSSPNRLTALQSPVISDLLLNSVFNENEPPTKSPLISPKNFLESSGKKDNFSAIGTTKNTWLSSFGPALTQIPTLLVMPVNLSNMTFHNFGMTSWLGTAPPPGSEKSTAYDMDIKSSSYPISPVMKGTSDLYQDDGTVLPSSSPRIHPSAPPFQPSAPLFPALLLSDDDFGGEQGCDCEAWRSGFGYHWEQCRTIRFSPEQNPLKRKNRARAFILYWFPFVFSMYIFQ